MFTTKDTRSDYKPKYTSPREYHTGIQSPIVLEMNGLPRKNFQQIGLMSLSETPLRYKYSKNIEPGTYTPIQQTNAKKTTCSTQRHSLVQQYPQEYSKYAKHGSLIISQDADYKKRKISYAGGSNL